MLQVERICEHHIAVWQREGEEVNCLTLSLTDLKFILTCLFECVGPDRNSCCNMCGPEAEKAALAQVD